MYKLAYVLFLQMMKCVGSVLVYEREMISFKSGIQMRKLLRKQWYLFNKSGHLTGCGNADLHNSLASASYAFSEHLPHKTEKFA